MCQKKAGVKKWPDFKLKSPVEKPQSEKKKKKKKINYSVTCIKLNYE